MFGIAIKRTNREDYVLPMQSLEQIDEIFLTYSPSQILEILKQNDSVITETDPNQLSIKKYVNGKWKEIEKIEEKYILEFSFEDVINTRTLHILYNHFASYLKKGYIRDEFKEVIETMNQEKERFLESYPLLNYEEIREIRVYLAKTVDIKPKSLKEYQLKRKVEEKKAS